MSEGESGGAEVIMPLDYEDEQRSRESRLWELIEAGYSIEFVGDFGGGFRITTPDQIYMTCAKDRSKPLLFHTLAAAVDAAWGHGKGEQES